MFGKYIIAKQLARRWCALTRKTAMDRAKACYSLCSGWRRKNCGRPLWHWRLEPTRSMDRIYWRPRLHPPPHLHPARSIGIDPLATVIVGRSKVAMLPAAAIDLGRSPPYSSAPIDLPVIPEVEAQPRLSGVLQQTATHAADPGSVRSRFSATASARMTGETIGWTV